MKYKLILLLMLLTLFPTLVYLNNQIDYYPYLINASNYLISHYNSSLGLIYESELNETHFMNNPNQYFWNTYWLYSDNLYCSHALRDFSPLIAQNISKSIKYYMEKHNIPESGLFEALFNEKISIYIPDGQNFVVETDQNNTYYIVIRIHNATDEITDWNNYADLLCFQALNFYYRGNLKKANELWFEAYNMYDGKGLYDKATQNDGFYANYKLALLIYSAKIIKPNVDLEPLKRRLLDFQNQTTGGITSLSDLDGNPYGSCNAETTSLFILALDPNNNFENLNLNDLANLITRYRNFAIGLIIVGFLFYLGYRLSK